MFKILYILLISLTFTSLSEVITIQFDNEVYEKDMPTDYGPAVETIKIMEYLINSFDTAYSVLDSVNKELIYSIEYFEADLKNRLDSIPVLLSENDSMSGVIDSLSKNLSVVVSEKTDGLLIKIDELETKPVFNFGISGSYSATFTDRDIRDYSVSPILIYNNFFGILNLGVYEIGQDFHRRVGIGIGILYR